MEKKSKRCIVPLALHIPEAVGTREEPPAPQVCWGRQ